jgi:hypothetical protein
MVTVADVAVRAVAVVIVAVSVSAAVSQITVFSSQVSTYSCGCKLLV